MNVNLLKRLSIEDYYLKEFFSKGEKFTKGHPHQARLVLCPLHDDKNPSMGFIHGKDGVSKFHCFGCGKAGNVVDLHRGTHKGLSEEQALKEVCKILDIPYEEETTEEAISQDIFDTRIRAIKSFNSSTTQAGFSRIVRELAKDKPKSVLNRVLLNTLWLKED